MNVPVILAQSVGATAFWGLFMHLGAGWSLERLPVPMLIFLAVMTVGFAWMDWSRNRKGPR